MLKYSQNFHELLMCYLFVYEVFDQLDTNYTNIHSEIYYLRNIGLWLALESHKALGSVNLTGTFFPVDLFVI